MAFWRAGGTAAAVAAVGLVLLKLRQSRREEKAQKAASIKQLAQQIYELLVSRKPRRIEGLAPEMYRLPPFIEKQTWSQLGDALRFSESLNMNDVPGERFITLRLDGSGFSKLTRRMASLGVFSQGYSEEFADIMRDCCQSLMTKFSASCGYTQSDEMTIVIPATRLTREYANQGTLAASHVTSLFNFRIQRLFAQSGLSMEASSLATFDCRMGSFATMEEALSLVLWRAADCGVNGVSDAVYKSKIPGARKVMCKSTSEKLQWLAEHGLLPLKPHQAYGSFFVRCLRQHALNSAYMAEPPFSRTREALSSEEGVNPKTGETVQTLRSGIEEVPDANILCLAAAKALLPQILQMGPDAAAQSPDQED